MAKQTDPVCGMQIEEEDAAGKTEHKDRTYYFCAEACQRKFEENPEQYTDQQSER